MRRYWLGLWVFAAAPAFATDYKYCISSDVRRANIIVHSGPIDFGKEWFRVRAAQDFCSATGATGCSASDYSQAQCGDLTQESIQYHSVDGSTLSALVSGNPLVMAEATVEVATGVPIKVTTEGPKAIGKAANKVCRWFAPHC